MQGFPRFPPPRRTWLGFPAGWASYVQLGQRLFVGCASGVIEILAVQPVGKNRMTTAEFLRGYRERLGEQLIPPTADSSGSISEAPCPEPDL